MRGSFSLLHEKIREALLELNFKEPTDVQQKAMPELLKGKSMLIIAPTGSGKTEAAILPVFNRIITEKNKSDGNKKGIRAIYITPLRALNRDLFSRLSFFSEKLGISIEVRHGDTSKYFRRKQALSPPEILITTPETLQAILPAKRMREHLKNVRFVIIDEVHEIAESERGTQLSTGLQRLKRIAEIKQVIALSATISEPEKIKAFVEI